MQEAPGSVLGLCLRMQLSIEWYEMQSAEWRPQRELDPAATHVCDPPDARSGLVSRYRRYKNLRSISIQVPDKFKAYGLYGEEKP